MQYGNVWARAVEYDTDRLRVALDCATSRQIARLLGEYDRAIAALGYAISVLTLIPHDCGSEILQSTTRSTKEVRLSWSEVCSLKRHSDVGESFFLELLATAQGTAKPRPLLLGSIGEMLEFATDARGRLAEERVCLARILRERGPGIVPSWTGAKNTLFQLPEGALLALIEAALNIADLMLEQNELWRLAMPIAALGVATNRLIDVYEHFGAAVAEVRAAGNPSVPFPFVPPSEVC